VNPLDPAQLAAKLKQAGLAPKKDLGQNFLIDNEVLASILAAAELAKTDHVVEIGTGPGTLTAELAQSAKHVTALEFDTPTFKFAQKELAEYKNIELLNLDVRRFEPPAEKYKLIANIPYYLTSPILRQFFVETEQRPQLTVLLIQKEVAKKIISRKGSVLAWQVRIFGEAAIVKIVPKECFLPPPKVASAVIQIRLRAQPLIPTEDIAIFFQMLHVGFRAPRKKIGGSLIAGLPIEKDETRKLLAQSGVNTDQRPEDLSLDDWLALLPLLRSHV